MKINHFVGGIFLVAGTTIGAGMLALPIMSSFTGFIPSLLIFAICWLVMLTTAYFFLDVNLSLEGEVNLISMAKHFLGPWGKALSWVFYLLLLYSLAAAYISGSAPLFQLALFKITGYQISLSLARFALPILFGIFVYFGTLGVDLINRFMMFGLVVSYLLLIGFLPTHIQSHLLLHIDWKPTLVALPVVITSFGYHIIIPSLTTYMNHDKKHLRITLLIGSIFALAVFVIWQTLILGTLPIEGENGLLSAWKQGISVTVPLAKMLKNKWIQLGAHYFSFFAIVTSFLGVSLSLSDFLTDGLKIKKSWEGRLIAIGLTFIPPLVFLFTFERGFIVALEYAAVFVAILLIFLPALMAWHLKQPKFYKTIFGRFLLLFVMLFAFFVIGFSLLEEWGYFKFLTSAYGTI